MTDDDLLAAFEDGSLDGDAFTHEAHVRVAWCCLQRDDFAGALARFSTALRRFAAAKGAAGKYHETMTVAWLALVAERYAATPGLPWTDFAARHADLLDKTLLSRYYTTETLQSDRARRVFVLPDAERTRGTLSPPEARR
jgi:hypothetical protein